MTKLLAAAGAPVQLKEGEILLPVQPKPLNTCSSLIVAPSLTSPLFKLMLWAEAVCAPRVLAARAAAPSTVSPSECRVSFIRFLLMNELRRIPAWVQKALNCLAFA